MRVAYPIAFALIILGVTAGQTWASSCQTPYVPECATFSDRFDSREDFVSCQRDMRKYRGEVDRHLQCIQEEFDSAMVSFGQRGAR